MNRENEDKKIIEYMTSRKWEFDEFHKIKIDMLNLARKHSKEEDICEKIGAMLLFNQVIESFIKDCIDKSIKYIKAEISPTQVSLKTKYDVTFGQLIKKLDTFGLENEKKDLIITSLEELNEERNQIVHNILKKIKQGGFSLENYFEKAEDSLEILISYYLDILDYLEELKSRGYSDFVEEDNIEEEKEDRNEILKLFDEDND